MPSINLAELRARAQELAGLLPDASAFRAGVRRLMESYAHRLLRRGPSMAERGALQAWDIPGVMMRELEATLVPAAAADPQSALAAADALWTGGRLEERVLSVQLAGASAESDRIYERINRWTDEESDPTVLRKVAESACRPLRRSDPVRFQKEMNRYLELRSSSLHRFAWMALRAWLDEDGAGVLAALDFLPRALRENDPEAVSHAAEILSVLSHRAPAETRKWLDDLTPELLYRGRAFLRAALPLLPQETAEEIRDRLRNLH